MLPECRIFAGPNGSGKSTVTPFFGIVGSYINADDIARSAGVDVLEAARVSDRWRVNCLQEHMSFTSETVLSTNSKLNLMRMAKHEGFFVKGVFILTTCVDINIARVQSRVYEGGHDVPIDKIRSRYEKSLAHLPEFIELCDVCHVIDNSESPTRIFKKRKDVINLFSTSEWSEERIYNLITEGILM